MGKMRVLIVDGSVMYRNMFAQAAADLVQNAAVVCVTDASEAIDNIKTRGYEVIVIDAETQGMDALLEELATELAKVYVLITARPSPLNDSICEKALAKGASDCLVKPINSSYVENFDVIKRKMAGIFEVLDLEGEKRHQPRKTISKDGFRPEIILIAASTGGPPALENILSKLSWDFPVPILIVQHMLQNFSKNLAQNLNQKSPLTIKIAEDGETVKAGTVYVAPGGTHMKLDADNTIRLDDAPPINGIRPAADALFASVASSFSGSSVLAVILTGMGRDGEKVLALLKEKKDCFCLAQSEKTSVVYGMPRVVAESGLADKILDLDEISLEIESFNYESDK